MLVWFLPPVAMSKSTIARNVVWLCANDCPPHFVTAARTGQTQGQDNGIDPNQNKQHYKKCQHGFARYLLLK